MRCNKFKHEKKTHTTTKKKMKGNQRNEIRLWYIARSGQAKAFLRVLLFSFIFLYGIALIISFLFALISHKLLAWTREPEHSEIKWLFIMTRHEMHCKIPYFFFAFFLQLFFFQKFSSCLLTPDKTQSNLLSLLASDHSLVLSVQIYFASVSTWWWRSKGRCEEKKTNCYRCHCQCM